MSSHYSIIIPTLNEERYLLSCLKHLNKFNSSLDIIIADGGSTDSTVQIARQNKVKVVLSEKGRGFQLNAGAKAANNDTLLFLHADTKLPVDAFERIEQLFKNPKVQIAKFQMKFDHDHWLFKIYSFFTRFDSIFTSFGDQGIVVRKSFFQSLGGFPHWLFLEDVRFFQLARQNTKIYCFTVKVITSARRFIKNGIIRQQLFNMFLIGQYLCGVSPAKIAHQYRSFQKH